MKEKCSNILTCSPLQKKNVKRTNIIPIIKGYRARELTHLLNGQVRQVGLIIRQLLMKSGCLDNLLTLWDLAISNLHKQHSPIATSKIFYCFPQLQITESNKVFVCDHKFHKLPHPNPKSHPFLTARRRSKENLSIPADTQEHFRTYPLAHKIFVPWVHIRNNEMKS